MVVHRVPHGIRRARNHQALTVTLRGQHTQNSLLLSRCQRSITPVAAHLRRHDRAQHGLPFRDNRRTRHSHIIRGQRTLIRGTPASNHATSLPGASNMQPMKTSITIDQDIAGELRLLKAQLSREAGKAIYLPQVLRALLDNWNRLDTHRVAMRDDTVHIHPIGDLIAHDLDGEVCPCYPRQEPVQREDGTTGWLIIHNSLDGREQDE